jgi:AcrR family transcriptional regulator
MTVKRKSLKSATPRRGRNAVATKAAFIAAGERVFASKGFDGATLDMLAAEAGANKALVSYYFGSKEGLYDVVIAMLVRDTIAAVSGRTAPGKDPADNFRRYVLTLAEALNNRPTFPSILMREYVAGSMQSRKTPAEEVLQFYRLTEAHYEAGRRVKLFRKVDPHMLHLSIIGPLIHFVLTTRFREQTIGQIIHGVSNPPIAKFAAHLSGLVLDGLRRTE